MSGCNAKRDTSLITTVCWKQGSLPLRRRMDDEEEDMSRPISQLWGTPFRDVKYEDRATQIATGQALAAVTAAMSTSQSHNNNGIETLPCSLHRQPHVPFHGNAGLRSHFPAQFEPMEDRGERQIEEEEEEGRGEDNDRMAERPEEQVGVSHEAQIGRKLREIGDKFHQDHVELFMRHQRQNLPVWMRLTMALFGFLFPREGLIPRLRGEQR
ncbi:BCL2 modifying factor 2 isoform X3 [Embiotoca jacksoni]|uniref:BCL2 modifying factor 2 isoform X3 n=1 Tax=Embiotoca jacksoni TaxID=100190 RepID=UPI003704C6EA